MPQYFDSDVPVARRKSKDLRIHRVVRRDMWPDYISKQMVPNETFCNVYSYLDSSNTIDPSTRMTDDRSTWTPTEKFPAIEVADPFGMRTFHMKYSLNKKYRWELDEELSENVFNYQNELLHLKTSYLRTVTRDTGWLYKGGYYWQKRNKVCAVEFATVRDGEVMHRYANKANRYDLLRKPRKPRKGKTRWSREEVTYQSDHERWSYDPVLHVLYKTTTTSWDHRVRNKCDKKVALKKRDSRKGFIKKNCDVKIIWPDDVDDEYEIENVEGEFEEYSQASPTEVHDLLTLTCVVINSPQQKERHRSNKTHHPDYTDAYKDWLFSASMERPKTTSVSRRASTDSSRYETVPEDNEKVVSHVAEPRFLNSIVIPIPKRIPLCDYVLDRFPAANRIERLQPETFLVAVDDEVFVEALDSTSFSGYISIRMESSEVEPNQSKMRWTFNESVEVLNDDSWYNVPSSSGSAALCSNAVKVLPPSLLSETDCFSESAMKKELVKEWLANANMQATVKESIHSNTSSVCEVCLGDDQHGFSLHCGHHFCATCWVLNAQQCLSTGIVPIQCMSSGCCAALEIDQALTVMPYEDCLRYEHMLWNKIVLREGWMYCEDCGCVIRPRQCTSKSRSIVLCACGAARCMKCKSIFHSPMPCRLAEQYCDILRCNGEEMERAVVRVSLMLRRCPKCRSCCERTEGCNHMQCRCGYEFCYACGERFDGSHYECEKVVLQRSKGSTKSEALERIRAHLYGHLSHFGNLWHENKVHMKLQRTTYAAHKKRDCSRCFQNKEQRIHLFDVHGGVGDETLQAIYEDIWQYREQRTPKAVALLRKRLNRISAGFDIFADVYIAAMEVMELSVVTLQFLKKASGHSMNGSSKNDDRITRMSNCITRLKFAIERFRLAIETNAKKARMERLSALIESSAKELLIINPGGM